MSHRTSLVGVERPNDSQGWILMAERKLGVPGYVIARESKPERSAHPSLQLAGRIDHCSFILRAEQNLLPFIS